MPKRLALKLLNLVWHSTAFLIVLLAVIVTTGRELLPRINFDDRNIIDYISQHTGANIQTSNLHCQWTALYPEINASTLLISTPDLNVRMENVQLSVDIFSSILKKSPVFDTLKLTNASITYTQQESNHQNTTADPEKIWRAANLIFNNDIHIQNLDFTWNKGEKTRIVHLSDFRVEKTFYTKKFFMRLVDDDNHQNFYAIGEMQGNELKSSEGKVYIKADNLLLNDWAAIPGSTPLKMSNSDFWISWDGINAVSAITKIHLEPQATATSSITLPEIIDAEASVIWKRDAASTITLHTLQLQQQGNTLPIASNIQVSLDTEKPQEWRAQSPELVLENLMQINRFVPAGTLQSLFSSLNPQGRLRNVDLHWDNSKPLTDRMLLQANADNINSDPWNGVPGFTKVSGYIRSGIGYGFIDLDSRNGFSMFYPQIYKAAMNFQQARGRVQWQWLPERDTVLVGSDYASLSGDAGEARGNFWLDIPMGKMPATMYLAIGLRNSEAHYRDMFLPFILPKDLLAWLKTSIGGGAVPDAGFIYRGPLSAGGPYADAIQFYANVNNGELQFDPAWPKLTQLNAHVLVDDGNTAVRANSGFIYNSAIHGAYVEVLQSSPGLLVQVNARARGYAEDGLRVLRDTPLKSAVGSAVDNWRMPQGLATTALQLQIPLAGSTAPAKEDVRIALFDTQLLMDDLRLDFQALSGNITYETDKGLNSSEINTVLFEKPLKLNIASKKTATDLTIDINAKGSANIAHIADWARLTPLKMLRGQVEYDAALRLGPFGSRPTAQIGQFQISSPLKDIVAPLPSPFNKSRGEQRPFNLTVNLLQNNQQDYSLDYNKQISGFFSVRNGNLSGGEVVLLDGAAKPSRQSGNFLIRGTLPSGDLQQWLDLVSNYKKISSATNTNTNTNTNSLYPSLSVVFNNATWKDMSFPTLKLSANYDNTAWKIFFDSGNARGSAFFYDGNRIPDIAVSELKLYRDKDTSPTSHSSGTAASTINFADIPSLNIRIDHLFMNEMDIGSISTELRSTPKQLRLENLKATGPGYQLRDSLGTGGSTLLWKQTADGKFQSEFHGLLAMQGEQPAINQLGVDMFIVGKNVLFFVDLIWPGSPQDASLKSLSGNIYTEGKEGKYLQAHPNAAMRALGFINVATWARRLQLDFSDLGSKGITFDKYNGKLEFNRGVMSFTQPLEITTPSGQLALSGKAFLEKETLNLRLIATLPVSNNATWIAALAGGLPAAAGVYLVSKVFDKQINTLTSLSYRITGPMSEPDIQFERLAPPDEYKKTSVNSTDATKWF